MYKPHYLNVERVTKTVYGANGPYWSKTTTIPLGWKSKPPEVNVNKSERRFAKKRT